MQGRIKKRMSRPPRAPKTTLGLAIRAKRSADGQETARELGIAQSTLSRLEGGTHLPSAQTALVLARWLGWTMEEVMAAAGERVGER